MSKKRNNPETIAIHGGDYRSDPATNAVAVPIYRTTSYQFNSVDHAANLFALKEFGIAGIYAATIYKTTFQAAMERRDVEEETNPRPVGLWIDETSVS